VGGNIIRLKYPNLTNWQALKMALPFAWLDWFFMTIAVGLGHKHKLVTENSRYILINNYTIYCYIVY